MPNVRIEDYSVIEQAIVMSDIVIKRGSQIGNRDSEDIAVVNEDSLVK
jgi:glucose-1-phosphate adenylyltransferase